MTLSEIQEEAKMLISIDNVPESLEFAEKLEKSLFDNNIREVNPTVYQELSKIIFQLYVTAIPNIKDELLFNIISFNLIEALSPIWSSDRDLRARIETKYSIYPIELIKEIMRRDLLSLVEKNTQQIGSVPLHLSQDNPQAKPTIANWIEYYDRATGMNSNDNFAKSKFISGNTVVQTLNPAEKEALRKVLSFYDYLQTDETVLYQDLYNDEISSNNTKTESSIENINTNNPTTITLTPSFNPPQSHNTSTANGVMNNAPKFSPKPIPRIPVTNTKSSAPIVLTAKPAPIPKNLVNLKNIE